MERPGGLEVWDRVVHVDVLVGWVIPAAEVSGGSWSFEFDWPGRIGAVGCLNAGVQLSLVRPAVDP